MGETEKAVAVAKQATRRASFLSMVERVWKKEKFF
jgi:hypothetical protein